MNQANFSLKKTNNYTLEVCHLITIVLFQSTPPQYDVTKMKTPAVLYYAAKDWLSDPIDVNKLIPKIPNLVASHYYAEYNHVDFAMATNAPDAVYSDILMRIRNHTSSDIIRVQ